MTDEQPDQRRHFCLACHTDGLEHIPMVLVLQARSPNGPGIFECEHGHQVEVRFDEVSPRQALI